MNTQEILYNTNLDYLKKKNKELYNKVKEADVSNIKINIHDGNINYVEDGKLIYPVNSTEFVANKLESFFAKPTALYKRPSISEIGKFSSISDSFLVKIEEKMPEQLTDFDNYSKHLDAIPILLMFGVGTGQQIEQMISVIDVKCLIISDKNFSHLKLSMSIIDWRPIFEYFSKPGYKINFIVTESAKAAAYESINHIFAQYKHYSYYVNFYATYHSDFINQVISHIKDKYKISLTGWGFYDDEYTSITHTIKNLNIKNNIYNLKKPIKQNSSVFIVASGPSVDNDIEFIKKHKDDVVIFSCGSALKILEANGLIPDYHLEIERNVVTLEHLTTSMSKDYLKKINFIGLNVVYPEVYDIFKTTKIFFRENDCGSSVHKGKFTELDHTNPTVTNGAVSLASSIGFENIYLFGADMGYKDENSHHSKHSIYTMENASTFYNWKPSTIKKTYKANFDSENVNIQSTDILVWCRQRIENCIIEYNVKSKSNINYFNCSDGAFIEGSIPKKSNEIKSDEIKKLSKEKVLKAIENNFVKHDKKVHKLLVNNLKENKNEASLVIHIICELLNKNKEIRSYSQFFDLANNIIHELKKSRLGKKSSMISSLLNGTLSHMFLTMYTHALMSKELDESFRFIEYGFSVVKEFLEFVEKENKKIKL